MPNSSDTLKRLDKELERNNNLDSRGPSLIEALAVNAVRSLVAVLFTYWVLRSKGTR